MRGYAKPPQGRGLPRCPVLGSLPSPALRDLSVCSPSIADASGVALASIRRHNAAAFNALLFIPPPTAVGGGGLARGGFAPTAQNQTPLAVSLPFAVVTARGPDGLPTYLAYGLRAEVKNARARQAPTALLRFFFGLRLRLGPACGLGRGFGGVLAAALPLRSAYALGGHGRLPRGGVFPPLRSGGLSAAPFGRRFFYAFAPPNK